MSPKGWAPRLTKYAGSAEAAKPADDVSTVNDQSTTRPATVARPAGIVAVHDPRPDQSVRDRPPAEVDARVARAAGSSGVGCVIADGTLKRARGMSSP